MSHRERLVFALALSLPLAACHSTAAEVVQSQASTDLACPEAKVQVKPDAKEKGTYEADGCGKKATYACAGWDAYNQAPVCQPR